jgi:hypothetical protein
MKQIPLSHGHFSLVDDDDFETLMKVKWQARPFNSKIKTKIRAMTYRRVDGKTVGFSMSRVILGVTSKEIEVDHINGNALDNRKCNLRKCNHSQNLGNQKRAMRGDLPKGVTPTHRKKNKFRAICKRRFLGVFKTIKEASDAYDAAAIEEFGEFARPNNLQVA